MNNQIQKAIENSIVWKYLNEQINNLYKENNCVPSEEEYKAVREMIIMKTIAEDPEVRKLVAGDVYDAIRKGA